MQHEVKGDLLRVHHFLYLHDELIHFSILILSLHNGIRIETRREVLDAVCTLPLVHSHDAFSLIVDVVHRRREDLPVEELESTEHGDMSEIHIVNLVIVVVLGEAEIGLTHYLRVQIDGEVVVDYPLRIFALGLRLV
jgi:hypothetical protein